MNFVRKGLSIVFACVAACLFAQGTIRLGSTGVAEEEVASGNAVKVRGRGIGTNKTEALKDAYRDAIEQAVGIYVDAEQMAANNKLVKDQILTQSNAYIEKFDMIEETVAANGLVTIRILATVNKSALTKRLTDVMPAQTFKLGNDAQNVHAKMVTKEKRDVAAAALLKKTLEDLDPVKQLIRFTLADNKLLVHEYNTYSEKYTGYFYRFKFEVNDEKYNEEFLPMLLATLDQITLEPVKMLHWSRGVASIADEENRNAQKYIEGDKKLLSFGHDFELKKNRVRETRGMLCPQGFSGHYWGLIRMPLT